MYCPKCAVPNHDDAKFCRACGADISLVPQAVRGELAERLGDGQDKRSQRRRHRHGEKATIERAVRSLFMGFAFIVIAFAVKMFAPAGNIWWFWMFLPAAGMLAEGVGTMLRIQEDKKKLAAAPYGSSQTPLVSPPRASALPPLSTGELLEPPPSVTEATTRHLGIPVERKPKDV